MEGDSHRDGARARTQDLWRSNRVSKTEGTTATTGDQGPAGYRVGSRVGTDGHVHEARHPRFPGRVAIKLFPWAVGEAPAAVTAFAREAGRVSILRHPRIAQVLDSGVLPNRTPFVAMEFLPGQTLEELLTRRGPLTISQAFTVIRDIVLGLSAAHEAGVVHREIRPDNIFLVGRADADLGFVKVLDFGVSQLTWAAQAPGQGITVDAARYLAPEQVRRGLIGVDARADEYALAVLTYRMLRGPDPFLGPSISRASAVDNVLGRALHESPGERYASVGAFFRAFEEAIISSVPTPAPTQRRGGQGVVAVTDKAITREVALMKASEPQPTPPPTEAATVVAPVPRPAPPPTEVATVVAPVPRPAARPREVAPVATPEPQPTPPPREVATVAAPAPRPAPRAREVINHERALAERFFEEGDRHEQNWSNAPVARRVPVSTSEFSFTSFDRVPRRRTPLATVLLLAAIVGGGFAAQRMGWKSPRAVWDESAWGQTVHFFRAGLPWNQPEGDGVGVALPNQPETRPEVPIAPAPSPAPSGVVEPVAGVAAPAVVAEPTAGNEPPVVAAPAVVAEPPAGDEPPAVAPPSVVGVPAVVAEPPAGDEPSAVAPPNPSGRDSPPVPRGVTPSSRQESGSALRGYVWSPQERRLVPAPR